MMMRALLTTLALSAAGCSTAPPPGGPPSDMPDQCRASQYRYLVGRNRSEIPPEPPGANWRVTCTSCPVTMDYNPRRLNILYDERTGVVRDVKCG